MKQFCKNQFSNYTWLVHFTVFLLLGLSANCGTLIASFTSFSNIPVTASSYTASGNDISLSLAYAPETGTNLTVIKNTGRNFINGRFSNLAQGQTIILTYNNIRYPFSANYYGGNGNDLTLHWANDKVFSWGSSPVPDSNALLGKTVVSISSGENHQLALCSDGTLAAWGYNDYGQLGIGPTTGNASLVSIPTAINTYGILPGKFVVAIAAGGKYSLALCSDGTVVSWGRNTWGALGNNSTINSNVPVEVNTSGALLGKIVVAISAGTDHNLALCSDNTLIAWGNNDYGQLGNSTNVNSSVPLSIINNFSKSIVAISAGKSHSLALFSDGTMAAWGDNHYGQLGNNSIASTNTVNKSVNRAGVLSGKSVVEISAGANHNLALCSDSTLIAWGENQQGQLGVGYLSGTSIMSTVPVAVLTDGALSGKTVVGISANSYLSLAICSDGIVISCGGNVALPPGFPPTVSREPKVVLTPLLGSSERLTALAGSLKGVSLALATMPVTTVVSKVNMDYVLIGNPGNAADTTGYGSVAYSYQMGKYEVTNAQYTEFLNAKGNSNSYGVFNPSMAGYGITQSGSAGSYTYNVSGGFENKPVVFVSWFDAARFTNWQGNGQGGGDTETGAYTLNGATSGNAIAKNSVAKVYLPSENEWYKAAYYNGTTSTYSLYPNGRDTITTIEANYDGIVGHSTDVGSYTISPSFYGTFDQGGNVWEWNDVDTLPSSTRGIRGGPWGHEVDLLLSSVRLSAFTSDKSLDLGFRVASIVEPEIDVQHPLGTSLVDGTAKKSFGTVVVGQIGTVKRCTLKNTGTANLTGLAVSVVGTNPGDFLITSPARTKLVPGATTTFKITFKPQASGTRRASLRIQSNDVDENPFDIKLAGTGATP